MSIRQLFKEDEFFETIDPLAFESGQLCWAPVPSIEPIPRILDIQRNQVEEHEEIRFELRLANREGDFKKRDRSLPIKYLNLYSHEELLAQKAKRRPVIILTDKVDCYPEIAELLKTKGKKHQQQESLFVIPCYSIQKELYGTGYIQEIVARVECLLYRQFFFIPKAPGFDESIARFDRIMPVVGKSPAVIQPSNVRLSKDVFNLFLSMFIFCISGKTNENLETIKELVRDAYPKD